jgi:hypothetical protein
MEIQLDARHLVTHQRVAEAERRHVMLAEHRPPRGVKRPDPHPEEALILKAVPEIAGYVAALKQHSRKMLILALRQLLRMVREYARSAGEKAKSVRGFADGAKGVFPGAQEGRDPLVYPPKGKCLGGLCLGRADRVLGPCPMFGIPARCQAPV